MNKVICIDDSINPDFLLETVKFYPNWVKKGEKYTVRELLKNDDIVTGVLLEELENEKIYQHLLGCTQEAAFKINRFAECADETHYEEEQEEEVLFCKQ